MKSNRLMLLVVFSLMLVAAGCGPSQREREAQMRERLALEEKARQETVKANKAITEMTNRAFRRRTPEEEAKHQAEVQRQAQEIIDAQKKADAEAKAKRQP